MKHLCWLIIIFNILLNIHQIFADDKICVQASPCSCKFDNGTGYDLSELNASLKNNQYLSTPLINNVKYLFHPCTDISNPVDSFNYSICLADETNGTTKYNFMISAADAKFQIKSEIDVNLIYLSKNNTVVIKLACTNILEPHLYAIEPRAGDNSLILYSKHACLKSIKTNDNDSGMSVGALLLVSLFIMVFGYLTIGMSLKYFIVGARGSEIIPNINFWRDLPSLVKDGATFLFNGCRPTTQMAQNQDSYISI